MTVTVAFSTLQHWPSIAVQRVIHLNALFSMIVIVCLTAFFVVNEISLEKLASSPKVRHSRYCVDMGHTHCAICGTVAAQNTIAEHPRSTSFRQHQGKRHESDEERKECIYCSENSAGSDTESISWKAATDYDPDVLKEEDIRWTEEVQLLGFNVSAPGVSKTFVSGPGRPGDYGDIVVERGDDANSPERTEFYCYTVFDQDEKPTYPFHPLCYKLLQQVAKQTIRLDTLYEVFVNLTVDQMNFKEISYGDPKPVVGQWWRSRPGFEFMVANPCTRKQPQQLFEHILKVINTHYSLSVDLEHKVTRDPFTRFPHEVLAKIISYLEVESIFTLIQASWFVKTSFDSEEFWNRQVRTRLPWFWELHDVMNTEDLGASQAKQLFLWAQKVTKPRLWLEGPLIYVANRRRIWRACEQIIDLCNEHEIQHGFHLRNSLDRDVLEQAEVLQMPMINHFQHMKPIENVTLIWIHTWNELENGNPFLETFWDNEDVLVGISMTISGENQLFGQNRSSKANHRIEGLQLDAGDWIKAMILYVKDPDRLEGHTSAGIMSIDMISTSQKVSSLGLPPNERSNLCQRPLYISPEAQLVGITGQLANKQIAHLGLVQYKLPLFTHMSTPYHSSPQFQSELPNSHKYVWFSTLATELGHKLWNVSNLNVVEIPKQGTSFRSHCPDDLVPRHPLLFAKTRAEMATITKIWVFFPPSHHLMFLGRPATSKNIHRIAGISIEKNVDGSREFVHAGYDADLNVKEDERWLTGPKAPNWQAEYMHSFEIDGAGGETLTEVATTSPTGGVQYLRIRTNFDREVIFGRDDWRRQAAITSFQAAEVPIGETIAGFSIGFGDVGGWSEWLNESMNVYRLASSMGVLTWKDW